MAEQKIVPHLWFDTQAVAAAKFYVSVFPDSRITNTTVIKDTPSGDCAIVRFDVMGYQFMAINAGPVFTINPSISFSLNLKAKEEVKALWDKLADGGKAHMELGKYPFSEYYGWLSDKYGVSWQLIALEEKVKGRPKVTPALMFTKDRAGRAEEAIDFYTSIFDNAKKGSVFRYTAGQEPDKEGTVAHAEFFLEGQEFMALDSAREHQFTFNEAVSLMVDCEDQSEIDYFWDKLPHEPASEQCGWLKDKFGVSWQIVPANMNELMGRNPEMTTPAMLRMKKIIIADLEKAVR